MTYVQAVAFMQSMGYELCKNPAHGYRKRMKNGAKKGMLATVVACPSVQFYPKDTFLFSSRQNFIAGMKDWKEWVEKQEAARG